MKTTLISTTPFFTPTTAFLAWMREHHGDRAVIDAGCGFGNFVGALLASGSPGSLGIDLLEEKLAAAKELDPPTDPPLYCRLILGDTTEHGIMLLPQATIVFARPCHDASWIQRTVEHTKGTAQTFLYISQPGNAERDIGGFERRLVAHDIDIGEDGEECWEFRSLQYDKRQLTRWCLIDYEHGETRRIWVRDGGNVWFWGWGQSLCTKHGEIVRNVAYIVDDWLDWSLGTAWQRWNKRVNDISLDNGWMSPEGRLYRCAYGEHESLAYNYLSHGFLEQNVDVRSLERASWCKLQRRSKDGEVHIFLLGRDRKGCDLPMTEAQVHTFVDAGFVPPVYLLEEAEGDWSDLIARCDDGEFGGLDRIPKPLVDPNL